MRLWWEDEGGGVPHFMNLMNYYLIFTCVKYTATEGSSETGYTSEPDQ